MASSPTSYLSAPPPSPLSTTAASATTYVAPDQLPPPSPMRVDSSMDSDIDSPRQAGEESPPATPAILANTPSAPRLSAAPQPRAPIPNACSSTANPAPASQIRAARSGAPLLFARTQNIAPPALDLPPATPPGLAPVLTIPALRQQHLLLWLGSPNPLPFPFPPIVQELRSLTLFALARMRESHIAIAKMVRARAERAESGGLITRDFGQEVQFWENVGRRLRAGDVEAGMGEWGGLVGRARRHLGDAREVEGGLRERMVERGEGVGMGMVEGV